MPTLTLALKDLRLLLRDARSAVILLLMPLLLTLVLGLALGEGFGEKPDDRVRISVVNLDAGLPGHTGFPGKPWSEVVLDDLTATPGIRLEVVPSREEAGRLVDRGKRAAVVVFEPEFSGRMQRASFLTNADPPPVNPLGRDGVVLDRLALTLLRDPTQPVTASVVEQVAQVTMLRVVIPWMIGRAFERVGDDSFMAMVGERLNAVKPIPAEVLQELDPVVQKLLAALTTDPEFAKIVLDEFGRTKGSDFFKATQDALVINKRTPEFQRAVHTAFTRPKLMERVGKEIAFGEVLTPAVRAQVGPKVQDGVQDLFSNYQFRAKTWAELTKSATREGDRTNRSAYADTEGQGFLKRGAVRYQILVPSYTVMFAFFLVLTVGWLFVAERKHGTLLRLRAAPLSRGQILLGKLLPCLLVSLAQGFFLLLAGKIVFGMSWGVEPLWLIPVVVCTSAAAVGLAMLAASVARTETQVAVYGTMVVLVLGGISGSLMPRDLMPEQMKQLSLVTPQAWALDAYSHLLGSPAPQAGVIAQACLALLGFGAAFLALAWWRMDLE
jgi:ABC-type multidrug transport system permease subunit